MNQFKLFMAIFSCCTGVLSTAAADQPSVCPSLCGLYGGMGTGLSYLYGKRTDFIFRPLTATTLTLFNNKDMRDISLETALFLGYKYQPSGTAFNGSLEASVSYGPFESTVFRAVGQAVASNQVSFLKRGMGFGLTARVGYAVGSLNPYVLVGGRSDRFSFKSVSSAQEVLRQREFVTGIDYGIGVEKKVNFLRVGLELKLTAYKNNTFKATDAVGDSAVAQTKFRVAALMFRLIYPFG